MEKERKINRIRLFKKKKTTLKILTREILLSTIKKIHY